MSDFMDWVIATLILILASMGIFLFGLMLWWAVAPESEERKARRIAEETPRIYAQVDGCTVYTWLANGRNHYFTKCPTKVTTESWHGERSGKTTKEVSETIETER
jgi:hypothetical protein